MAAALGDQERVEQLLKRDARLARNRDSARKTPLSYAAGEGHLHIVRLLLEHGAEPNAPEDSAPAGAALFNACYGNHLEVAQCLLEHGANPNAGTDSNGCCLTISEVCHGERAKPLQELLRRHGACTPPYDMSVPEMKRAIRKRQEVIRHDEFLDCVMAQRDTALLELYLDSDPTILGHVEHPSGIITYPRPVPLSRKLLERGLDPNRSDWLSKTFLHACAENGDRSAAALFLDAGADINSREVEFCGTPLAAAVRSCDKGAPGQAERQLKMVGFLLQRGAATNLPGDKTWATPLAWARKQGLKDIEQMLLKHEAH